MLGNMANISKPRSPLDGPPVHEPFARALDEVVSVASQGQPAGAEFFNPSDDWLVERMRIFQDLPLEEQAEVLRQYSLVREEAEHANESGRAATKVGPPIAIRLDTGGLAFYSQLGVARRPDLTQYFVEGYLANRDALSFSTEHQELFSEVLPYITEYLKASFAHGDSVVQSDRQICDAPGRAFHARQLLCGTDYLQIPYLWRQLTFDLPDAERSDRPHIIELSLPCWLEDLGLPDGLKARIKETGLTQLVFKAPTRGLSLHLGMDYVGEHKMGPLSIAMFLVKQQNGLALQAALSVARITTLNGEVNNAALVTTGPSLHGKSTLTIMLDPESGDLSEKLGIQTEPGAEGVYPMNDDIVLLEPLGEPIKADRHGRRYRVFYGIDGTENNFYAVPYGLTAEVDPITHEVLRGTDKEPYARETLENVVVDAESGSPDFLINPTRNMRAVFSRSRLVANKRVDHLLELITGGGLKEAAHVPMEHMDRILWQSVMRENTVIPPLRRITLAQYVRVLMYGEAVQMGAAVGAIGKPYVEYFSDPFIMGLEDENANVLYHILRKMETGGLPMEFYVFNTGGVGAESSEEASGPRYKKIPRELTLMLQEAVLRGAVKFEYDSAIGSDGAAAIVDKNGKEIVDLREQWHPLSIYGEEDYAERVLQLRRKRFYGSDPEDKAGILRYTKVTHAVIDIAEIPLPTDERELATLLSFYWHVDRTYTTLTELVDRRSEGMYPLSHLIRELHLMYHKACDRGLDLSPAGRAALLTLGVSERRL
jgi:hypothetical protein